MAAFVNQTCLQVPLPAPANEVIPAEEDLAPSKQQDTATHRMIEFVLSPLTGTNCPFLVFLPFLAPSRYSADVC